MRIKLEQFYRQFGVRKDTELNNPRLFGMDKSTLPIGAIAHFWPQETSIVGPSNNESFLSMEAPQVFIEHVTELTGTEGSPRRTSIQPQPLVLEYRRYHRQYKRLMRDRGLESNPRNLLVVNYSPLNHLYRYMPSYRATYYRWYNQMETFVDKVNDLAERFPNWKQFFELELPDELPSRQDFAVFSKSVTVDSMRRVNGNNAMFLFELWQWLGSNREEGVLSKLSEKALDSFHLMLRSGTRFTVISLGQLNDWRAPNNEPGTKGIQGEAIQRRFLMYANRTLINQTDESVEEDNENKQSVDRGSINPRRRARNERSNEQDSTVGMDDDLGPLEDLSTLFQEHHVVRPNTPRDITLEEQDIQRSDHVPEEDVAEITQDTVPESSDDNGIGAIGDEFSSPLVSPVVNRAKLLLRTNQITPRQYERAVKDAQIFETLKSPFDENMTLEEYRHIPPEDLVLISETFANDRETVTDKSMLNAAVTDLTKNYQHKVMKRDIVGAVMSIQKRGVSVVDWKTTRKEDRVNCYDVHKVKLKTIRGETSTVEFRIPVIMDDQGTILSNGTEYKLRLQRVDLPIRKVNPTRVALTSYYKKIFVERSSRRNAAYGEWICDTIIARGDNHRNRQITELKTNSVFKQEWKVPLLYSTLASAFISFSAKVENDTLHFYFDHGHLGNFFTENEQTYQTDAMAIIGRTASGRLLGLDPLNILHVLNGNEWESMGRIQEVLELPEKDAPLPMVEMGVSNKTLPVGFVLAYSWGFENLVNKLGCQVERHPRGERFPLLDDQYTLAFEDETWVFSRLDVKSTMILSGLRRFSETLRQFSYAEFNREDVYYRMLDGIGLGVRFVREIDDLQVSWMDPTTEEILRDMGEPTNFDDLLVRATELLMTEYSPHEMDPACMRYRGAERMSGIVYNTLHRAVKRQQNMEGTGSEKIEVTPYEVFQNIVQDPAVLAVKQANPLQNIREQEGMTYRGIGGRSDLSMKARNRIYHENDKGTLSEATVDSGSVGVVAYMAPDANFTSLRGITRRFDKAKDGNSSLLSSIGLLSPQATHDDAKRLNFISIQADQGVYAEGYDVMPLRTGYEQVIAHRVGDLFASEAKEDGKVVSLTDTALVVEYKSGNRVSFELGTRFGTAAGVTHPQLIKALPKEGSSFKKGSILAYNDYFFKVDPYAPQYVNFKNAVLCTTAIMDNIDTLEDGSIVSQDIADKLVTKITDIRNITVNFEQSIMNMVKIGDHVDLDTVLCNILENEEITAIPDDDIATDILNTLSRKSPKAKSVGDVLAIDCYYYGKFEDLSENLQEVVKTIENRRKKTAKDLERTFHSSEVDSSFRLKGKPLEPNSLVLQFYINHPVSFQVADKAVFGNQMKTVISKVMQGVNRTESGIALQGIFGNTSIEDRMVYSPKEIGMTNRLLRVLGKHVSDLFNGDVESKLPKRK